MPFTSEQVFLKTFWIEDRIEIATDQLVFYRGSIKAQMSMNNSGLSLEYKGHQYRLDIDGAILSDVHGDICLKASDRKIVLFPRK